MAKDHLKTNHNEKRSCTTLNTTPLYDFKKGRLLFNKSLISVSNSSCEGPAGGAGAASSFSSNYSCLYDHKHHKCHDNEINDCNQITYHTRLQLPWFCYLTSCRICDCGRKNIFLLSLGLLIEKFGLQ